VRIASLALLCSVFVLHAARPRSGELWIDARGQGASATIMVRTHAHLLLVGSGETYGSGGHRFARYLLPQLRAAGYAGLDLWLPGMLTRDTQSALMLAAAELPVHVAVVPAAVAAPPELQTCVARRWLWDGIHFALHPGDDGRRCELTAAVGTHDIVLQADALASGTPVTRQAHLVFDAAGLRMRPALIGL
jgi:hypothetical protein